MPRELKSINVEVGRRVRQRRTELRLTREALAKLVGYSSNFVQEVERGRSGLSSESICAFAKALNCSTDALLLGRAANNYDSLLLKLEQLPEDKQERALRILEDMIAYFI